jgi:hypothetical protein
MADEQSAGLQVTGHQSGGFLNPALFEHFQKLIKNRRFIAASSAPVREMKDHNAFSYS